MEMARLYRGDAKELRSGGQMKRLGCCGIFLLLLIAGCQTGDQDASFVLFDKKPILISEEVVDRGVVIGHILATETAKDNTTRVQIRIAADQRHRMTDQVVFVAAAGRLTLSDMKKVGNPQGSGAIYLGFRSGKELFWFKTRTLFSRSAAVRAQREALRLSARFP